MKHESKNPRIIFDTNVLISAGILPNSLSRKAFERAPEKYHIVSSKQILEELIDVIERPHLDKYFNGANTRFNFLMQIARVSEYFETHTVVSDCRDPDDNKILELAIDTGAQIIITGDDDLLVLHPYRGIQIVKSQAFLEILDTE
jgi:putative PIN family toxin of toxin-antitoxin system